MVEPLRSSTIPKTLLNGVSFSESSKELHGYSPLPYKRDHFSYPVSSAFCYLLLPLYQSPILFITYQERHKVCAKPIHAVLN